MDRRTAMKKMFVILCLVSSVAHAFSVRWTTIDAGGIQQATGGAFRASVTVGQPDAGDTDPSEYQVFAGFWAGMLGATEVAPWLRIALLGLYPAVYWPADATNWMLEANTDLIAASWSAMTNTPQIAGSELYVTINPPQPHQNFRLHRAP